MNISLIAAIGKNNELGKNGELIWRLPNDLKFFKQMTVGHTVVMGRKTFESLQKILPNRKNIVISTNDINNSQIEIYKNIKEFLLKYKDIEEEIFIIGGATIYRQFIDLSNKMYLTEIDAIDKEADVYYPTFNKEEWDRELISNNEDNCIKYNHVLYKRK